MTKDISATANLQLQLLLIYENKYSHSLLKTAISPDVNWLKLLG